MKDRSMATGAYPLSARTRTVTVEGSWTGGGYATRKTGRIVVVVMSDGSEVACGHPHGHKTTATVVKCGTRLVRKLNDAAGIPEDAR